MDITNLEELESEARRKLLPMVYDYYASGAEDEVTLRENRSAFAQLKLAYKVLAGVGHVDCSQEMMGRKLDFPVMVAPMGFQRLAHEQGELAVARAAGRSGTIMVLSTMSNTGMEAVKTAATGPVWFQLYVYKDRKATESLVNRAEASGCEALVLTVDVPVLGRRERDKGNRFHLPEGFSIENMLGEEKAAMPPGAKDSGLAAYFASMLETNLSWDDLDWLRGLTRLPIYIKGVVRPDDAVRAAECGVEGIVVSNHGGRQLDTSPATISVLPKISEALEKVKTRPVLLMDGGVRRGTDVVKAIALGADAVLLGRPVLWGLTLDGEAGAFSVLEHLKMEFKTAMALCGARSVKEITRDLVI